MDRLWCVTTLFNPAGYRSRVENYYTFRQRLERQSIKLLTVELAFNNQEHVLPKDDMVVQLRSRSILWQKERLLNYGLTLLPPECDRVVFLDADLLLPDGWQELLMNRLDRADFVQIFQRVARLKRGERVYGGAKEGISPGIAWQSKTFGKDWLKLHRQRRLSPTESGFGWAFKRQALQHTGGLYDRLICGSGDGFLADCLLGSFGLHRYWSNAGSRVQADLIEWRARFALTGDRTVDYLPMEIQHLWHGSLRDRGYQTRELLFRRYGYNPKHDLALVNNVWEWATPKPEFQRALIDYFRGRREDGRPRPAAARPADPRHRYWGSIGTKRVVTASW